MRKVIILFALVILVVLYVNKPVMEKEPTFKSRLQIAQEREDSQVVGDPINRAEINSFLEIWPEYKNSWVSLLEIGQLSFTTSRVPAPRYSYFTKMWLYKRGWGIDRFFYVEQRLKSIVKTLEVEDSATKTIKLLELQYANEKSPEVKKNVQNIITHQESLLNLEKVSRAERDLVRPHLKEVKAALED